ncbi:MAG: hypothetical protein ABI696_11765 [Rubrivivax sp.]
MNIATTTSSRAGPRAGAVLGHAATQLRRWLVGVPTVRPPAPRTRVEEACEVRALARQVNDQDPRFAADLDAAADRHERLPEAPRRR